MSARIETNLSIVKERKIGKLNVYESLIVRAHRLRIALLPEWSRWPANQRVSPHARNGGSSKESKVIKKEIFTLAN